ncbi:hypothetical protein MPSEU_000046600 [Mayamaea pseudoterrestris]|nr:hypothetical protein MPSEU_000046600 [Mayamaea pseudoterrestris]
MRVLTNSLLLLLATTASAQYVCKKIVEPVVLSKVQLTASYVAKPLDPPNFVCQTSKGVCMKDKVVLCHMQGEPVTLCIPETAVEAHMKQHKDDFCGCCGPTEKTIPSYCKGKAKSAF